MNFGYHRWFLLLVAAVVPGLLSGCGKKASGGGGSGGGMVIPVLAAEAKLMPVSESLSLVGTLMGNEYVEIKSETEGVIEKINFEEGQRVNKGDLLIQLDETKFTTALAEAEAMFKLSEATFERAKQLNQDKLISSQEYDQAAAAYTANQATVDRRKRDLKDTRIYAPFGGYIGARTVSPGQVIARNTSLTMLVDLDTVKVEVSVPERFLGQVRVGQELELWVAAFPGKKFRGRVYFVAPDVDPLLRTALLKAQIPNAQQELKPGMFANLDLTLQVREKAVVIPESALVFDQKQITVWVIGPDETVKPRSVKLGVRIPGSVEIVQGLEPGENVVVEGIQKLMPGAKVKAAPTNPPPAVTSVK